MNQQRKTISLGKQMANVKQNLLKPILYTGLIFGSLISLVMIVVGFVMTLPESQRLSLLKEGGPVESASAWMYLPTIITLIAVGIYQYVCRSRNDNRGVRAPWGPMCPWMLAAFVGCFIARELDFQKRFTTMSFLKTRFYVSGEVHLLEKAIGFLIVAAIAFMVLRLFVIYSPRLVAQFKRCQLLGILPVVAGLLIVFSKVADTGVRFLVKNDIVARGDWQKSASATEEMSEILIPVLFLSIALLAIKPRNSNLGEICDGEEKRTVDRTELNEINHAA